MPLSLLPLSFSPSFLVFIFTFPAFFLIVRANRRCLYAPQAKLSMLASRMSSNSFLFFLTMRSPCSLSFTCTFSYFLPFPRELTFRPRPRAVAATLNWIFPVSLTSYCIRCHSTYGCQRSRVFSPPTSHDTSHDSGNLAFALFSDYNGFLRSMRVDFFLISTRARVHPPCIKVSFRSSGFFCRDNVPGYFRVYLSILSSSPFVLLLHLFLHVSASDITLYIVYSCIISRVTSRVSRIIFFLSRHLFSQSSFFAPLSHAATVRSIYGVFTFSRGSSPLHHVCSRVGYYIPIASNFLLHI